MKTRKRIVPKALVTMMLAILLAGMLFPAQLDVYAAGDFTVRIADIDGLGEDFPGFTFELYEVGGYDGPQFVLNSEYADSGVTLPEYEKDVEPDQEAWLSAAESLANYIRHSEGSEAVTSFENIKPGDSISYQTEKDALYLLVAETVRYDNKYYTPAPIFVRTLNNKSDIYTIDAVLKMKIEPVVFKHSLMKTWDDNDNREARPKAIEVGIYYGNQLIDSVTLGTDTGKWTYTWTSEESGDTYCYISEDQERIEFQSGSGDQGWGVREFTRVQEMTSSEAKAEAAKMVNYNPQYSKNSSEDMESFVINNPYKGNPPPEPPKPGKKVKTGDESNLGLWIGIAAAACVLLIAFLLVRRKKNNDEE